MQNIFIVFDNVSFKPVHVGSSTDMTAEFRKILEKAIMKKKDKLSIWINQQWNNNNEVLFHELHFDLDQKELKHHLKYWKDQFSDLLIVYSAKQMSDEGNKLIEGLRSQYGSK